VTRGIASPARTTRSTRVVFSLASLRRSDVAAGTEFAVWKICAESSLIRVFSFLCGRGAVVRWWDNPLGELIVCTWDPAEAEDAQVHREAQGGVRALAAALRRVDLRNSISIFRNDSVGSLAALQKGSWSSSALQECATAGA